MTERQRILAEVARQGRGRLQFRELDARGSLRSDGLVVVQSGADPATAVPPEATHARSGPRRPWVRLPAIEEVRA